MIHHGLDSHQANQLLSEHGLNCLEEIPQSNSSPPPMPMLRWTRDLVPIILSHVSNRFKWSYRQIIIRIQSNWILKITIEQISNPLILLLMASGIISYYWLHEPIDAIGIAIAILLVISVGVLQEWRTEEAVKALDRLAPPTCRVFRDQTLVIMPAKFLVPGDLVELRTGDHVPADIQLVDFNFNPTTNPTNQVEHTIHLTPTPLVVDESMLTGESHGIKRTSNDIIYMGTLVRSGLHRGVVMHTGWKTRLGQMTLLVEHGQNQQSKSVIQEAMDALGTQLSFLSMIIIVFIVLFAWINGQPLFQMLTLAVSLAVAAIPEGLPVVTTITLALGMLRLARNQKTIVKRLQAMELLGSITTICFDKTGTLTENELEVHSITPTEMIQQLTLIDSTQFIFMALEACNDAVPLNQSDWHGNAVDIAIRRHLKSQYYSSSVTSKETIAEFSSSTRFMGVKLHTEQQQSFIVVKGAVETISEMCTSSFLLNDTMANAQRLMSQGLRVLLLAAGDANSQFETNSLQSIELIPIALIALQDKPRIDAKETVIKLQQCGIHCIMITGDSLETASTLSHSISLSSSEKIYALSGEQAVESSYHQLKQTSVIYRASPEQKHTVIQCLVQSKSIAKPKRNSSTDSILPQAEIQKEINECVAMVGDGVNDAPAMQMADLGISMGGMHSTDVARATAQIILQNDQLLSIWHMVIEGRALLVNIQRFLQFQLSTSLAALGLLTICSLTRASSPMNAVQILAINIIMDGPPAQSLGVESADALDLQQSCALFHSHQNLLDRCIIKRIVRNALFIIFITLPVSLKVFSTNSIWCNTMTFAIFVAMSMGNAYSCRIRNRRLPKHPNGAFTWSLVASIISLIGIVHIPYLQSIFATCSLSVCDWILVLLSGISIVLLQFLPMFDFTDEKLK